MAASAPGKAVSLGAHRRCDHHITGIVTLVGGTMCNSKSRVVTEAKIEALIQKPERHDRLVLHTSRTVHVPQFVRYSDLLSCCIRLR